VSAHTPRPGPQRPAPLAARPAPGSVRRTWSIDVTFPDGLTGDPVVDVRGRDIRSSPDGAPEIVDELDIRIVVDTAADGITAIDAIRSSARLNALVGVSPRRGFGRRVAELFPEECARRSLCFSALEDLPGALLVSGYAHLREGAIPQTKEMAAAAAVIQADICIGWAGDGSVIATLREHGHNPVPIGPAAPRLEPDDAPDWHMLPPLLHPTVRRRRRLDVLARDADGQLRVHEHFRDSYAAIDGETVMHEYLVDAVVGSTGRIVSVEVDPRVLPWGECPGAAAGAQRLVGTELSDVPTRVRTDFTGVSTCTHLNSTLRMLADAGAIASLG
jgi:hypothetical protein